LGEIGFIFVIPVLNPIQPSQLLLSY